MEKKTPVQKELVRLREKKLSNGSISLYLDIYNNGKRRKEYLKLYLIDAKTRAEKEQNRQTLATAQALKASRTIEIQNGKQSFTKQFKENTGFLEYFRDMMEERHKDKASTTGTWVSWRCCLNYLEMYCGESTKFKDVTPEFIKGFRELLDNVEKGTYKTTGPRRGKGLSQNTKVHYFNTLKACINNAYENMIIQYNPLRGIKNFKEEEVKRDYLTLDELKQLAVTSCESPSLQRVFLFSCLTGLRKSDIEKLTWGEVQKFGDFTRIVFKQKKTGGQEYLDISPQAEKYLGERGNPNDLVFPDFIYNRWTSIKLRNWCRAAGFNKELTFHSGRHTFAVLMLDLGTDIYTVSKLLGHRKVATTQIYAKVLDKNKQNAVSLIPDIG